MLALVVLGLAGCTDVTVRTTLNPHGGGQRWEEVKVRHGSGEDQSVSHGDYVYLMGLGGEEGWTHSAQVREDSSDIARPAHEDTVHLFRREHRLRELDDWSRLDGTIRFRGTTEAHAGVTVGRVAVGDSRFLNRIRVGRGTTSDGRRTFTYRETFLWANGMDPLVEFVARDVADSLATMYGGLAPGGRGELIGLVRGGLWAAVDRGLLRPKIDPGFQRGESGEEVDEPLESFVRRTADELVKTIRPERPAAARRDIEAALRRRLVEDDWIEAWSDQVYPGFNLAMDTSIEFRLLMPGRITSSNAHEVEGDTLIWKFGPEHALVRPFEIHAESSM